MLYFLMVMKPLVVYSSIKSTHTGGENNSSVSGDFEVRQGASLSLLCAETKTGNA